MVQRASKRRDVMSPTARLTHPDKTWRQKNFRHMMLSSSTWKRLFHGHGRSADWTGIVCLTKGRESYLCISVCKLFINDWIEIMRWHQKWLNVVSWHTCLIRPGKRNNFPRFIAFYVESPPNTAFSQYRSWFLNDFFNWTMGYDSRSDVYTPYGSFIPHGEDKELEKSREEFNLSK